MHRIGTGNTEPEYVQMLEARVLDLQKVLHQNDGVLAATFRLPPQLSNLLGLLLALPSVDSDTVHQRLEVSYDAKVAKHRLKKALEPWGIEIHGKRGIGYWLSDEDKAKIKGLIRKPEDTHEAALAAVAEELGVIPEPVIPAEIEAKIAA